MDIKPNHSNTLTTGQSVNKKASLTDTSFDSSDPIQDTSSTDLTVELNTQDINQIQRSMANLIPFDLEKVEALIQAIQDGTYSINFDNIANQLDENI